MKYSHLSGQKLSHRLAVVAGCLLLAHIAALAETPSGPAEPQSGNASQPASVCEPSSLGSSYITVDSWIYPAVLRLYSLGYLDHVFLGMRPWTRASVAHMLEDAGERLQDAEAGPLTDEAQSIYKALQHELSPDLSGPCLRYQGHSRIESVYTVVRGMTGTPLRDSFHLGSTVINDYGRPYEGGVNNYSGASGYATAGPFTFYARAEFEGAPSATGYSANVANAMSIIDATFYGGPTGQVTYYYPQATIPMGPIGTTTNGRVMEAYVSAHVLNHEVSFGKNDQWLGPAQGGSFAYSNNADNVYGFEINRVEPLRIPLLSRITGPFRYEFLVGELQGHTYIPNPGYDGTAATYNVINPGAPWVHVEKISFRPTNDLEFGFERTVIWGGKGHEPITLHTFLKSFFSLTAGTAAEKGGRTDPGARFGSFDFSYRLPYVRNWLTLYTDGEVHDDVSPIDAPRRASWRPGLYLSHVPGVPKLDARVEVAWTDPPVSTSGGGHFMYWETIQKQGYTNQGQLFGDWIGREDKGGQAWLTYHLSGNEWIQVNARNQKAAKDFITSNATQYGTTLNDIGVQVVKRIRPDLEVNGSFNLEQYKAPIYLPGQQTVTTTNVQLTWYPRRKFSY
jgi:hypothetical protein